MVVPTHNRSRLLTTTLRSVLWQHDVDLEVIVVDDGSTDDTAQVVAGLGDPRIRRVHHPTPQGVSAARNRGIAEATSDWVAFVDDDDLWAPDKLTRQLGSEAAVDARTSGPATGRGSAPTARTRGARAVGRVVPSRSRTGIAASRVRNCFAAACAAVPMPA